MRPRRFPDFRSTLLPIAGGVFLVVVFVRLGLWQLDRAAEKRATQESFEAPGEYLALDEHGRYDLYQRVTASGRYLGERQVLIDNIVVDGRPGFYVITPFEIAAGAPLLLVNRGWLPASDDSATPPVDVGAGERAVRGRIGRLPRVGIRPGPAFTETTGWPKHAVWPEADEIAAALGRPVLPWVLLEDPDAAGPFVRRWQPQEIGPMRHLAYAVQWFALALAVAITGVVVYRRSTRT